VLLSVVLKVLSMISGTKGLPARTPASACSPFSGLTLIGVPGSVAIPGEWARPIGSRSGLSLGRRYNPHSRG
jgi:hypothetical protein